MINIMTELMNNELKTAIIDQELLSDKKMNLDEIELKSEKYKQQYAEIFKIIKKSNNAMLRADSIELIKQKYDLFLLESFITTWVYAELQKVPVLDLSFVLVAIATQKTKTEVFVKYIKKIRGRAQAQRLSIEYTDEIKEIVLNTIVEYLNTNGATVTKSHYAVTELHDALV